MIDKLVNLFVTLALIFTGIAPLWMIYGGVDSFKTVGVQYTLGPSIMCLLVVFVLIMFDD